MLLKKKKKRQQKKKKNKINYDWFKQNYVIFNA